MTSANVGDSTKTGSPVEGAFDAAAKGLTKSLAIMNLAIATAVLGVDALVSSFQAANIEMCMEANHATGLVTSHCAIILNSSPIPTLNLLGAVPGQPIFSVLSLFVGMACLATGLPTAGMSAEAAYGCARKMVSAYSKKSKPAVNAI